MILLELNKNGFMNELIKRALILIGMICLILSSSGQFAGSNDINPTLFENENCRIKTGEPGICRRMENCEQYYEALKKKEIPYSFLVRCSFVGATSEEVICCPENSSRIKKTTEGAVRSSLPTPRPLVQTFSRTNATADRPSKRACDEFSAVNPASLSFLIIDGVPVSPGEYPHMGGLIYKDGGKNGNLRCGCSLISQRYVMTAAHCVSDALDLPIKVRLGVVEWNSTDGIINPVDYEIEDIITHPEYISHLRYHDIALIRLNRDVEYTLYIRPACLYSDVEDIDSDIKLVVIGWGVTNVQTRERSNILLQTNVTTVNLLECNSTHISLGTSRSYKTGLAPGHYCAYDPELRKDSCQSDSGGPLQLVNTGLSTIVGVISFGLSCASAIPSVYTRVAFYLDWIESVVWAS